MFPIVVEGGVSVESDFEYYSRRAAEEYALAAKALSDQARTRHHQLASVFQRKANEAQSSSGSERPSEE